VTINLSAGIEKLVSDPSYRPTINVPWYISLIGSLGAIVVMFLINPIACIVAVILELALYSYLRRRSMKKRWGDVRAGMWTALARFALIRLRTHDIDPRNWRPQILLFVGDVSKRIGLVRLANWFNQNRGLVTACQIVVGDLKQKNSEFERRRQEMNRTLNEQGLIAFSEVDVVTEYESGAIDIAQANGIAGLQSNTVMFGWPQKTERLKSILRIMRAVSNIGKSTIIARLNWAHEPGQDKQIDIWWRGLKNNGDLMLLLAYLLSLNPEWNDSKIMVRSIVESSEEREKMVDSLNELVPATRIKAMNEVIIKPRDMTVVEVMHSYSSNSDVVFLGLMEPEPGAESEYAKRLIELSKGFNTTIFVHNAGEFAGHLI